MKFFQLIKKESKIIVSSLAIGLIVTASYSYVYADKIQQGIASEMLRFHVIANSDSDEDQQLKLMVRDAVLDVYSETLSSSSDIEESKKILSESLDEIKSIAETVIRDNGYDYPVIAYLGKSNFPTKEYGDIILPPGEYEALKIEIGKASGQNWWCVMFPPLCFVDITQNTVSDETKESLKDILTSDEYDIVVKTKAEEIGSNSIKVKFKIVEFWQEIKYPVDQYAADIDVDIE